MKKIIGILFGIQLVVFMFYGSFFFPFQAYQRIFRQEGTFVSVNFDGNGENFGRFIQLMYDYELFTVRIRPLAYDGHTHLFSTDVTLGGGISLEYGRFPDQNTPEFISTLQTGSENQVGLISPMLHGKEVTVSHLSDPSNIFFDGLYSIRSEDFMAIHSFIDSAFPYAHALDYFPGGVQNHSLWDDLNMSLAFMDGGPELGSISLVLWLLLSLTMLQYGTKVFKSLTIFSLHGISISRIYQKVTLKILSPFLLGSLFAYGAVIVYIFAMRFQFFFFELTVLHLALSIIFALFYLFILNSFIYFKLRFSNKNNTLKGNVSFRALQAVNHLVKFSFSLIFLSFSVLAASRILALHARLDAREVWEKADGVYRVDISMQGGWDPGLEEELAQQLVLLRNYLEDNHGGFVMDSSQMAAIINHGFSPYLDPLEVPPLEISPNGFRIDISPSFLNVNPLQAVNGIDILEQIDWNENTWNLLVPHSLRELEEEIKELYLDQFYFSRIHIYDTYAT